MRPDGQGTRGCSGATKACKSECAERRVCLWWPGGSRLLYLSRTFHRWSRDRAVRTVVDQALDLHVPAVPGGGEVREPLLESRRAAIGVPGVRDVVVEDFDVGVEAPPARLARLGEALETALTRSTYSCDIARRVSRRPRRADGSAPTASPAASA
jgi:hypothetical protein